MLSNARALTVLVVAIKATLWLYAAGALITLLFRVVLKLASCVDPETCHFPVNDGVFQSLFWPVIWAIDKSGFMPLLIVFVIALLISLFITAKGLERIVANRAWSFASVRRHCCTVQLHCSRSRVKPLLGR